MAKTFTYTSTNLVLQVGDSVELFLDQVSIPSFPESIVGVIQSPITINNCGNSYTYRIEYDETELGGDVVILRQDDVVYAEVISDTDILMDSVVFLTGDQTIAGIKTFSSDPLSKGFKLLDANNTGTSIRLYYANDTFILSPYDADGNILTGYISLQSIGDGWSLDGVNLTQERDFHWSDASGVVSILRSYVDSTAANAEVSIGDAWYDTTLKKTRVRLS